MPKEENPELEIDSKFVEEIYFHREVTDKFWNKDSKSYYMGRSEKEETVESFIFKGCADERVVLLMGSDCSTEDLMMDDEVLSDWSSEVLFNIDNITGSIITGEKIKLSQDTFKEAEMTNHMPSPVIVDNCSGCPEHKGFQDQVFEDMMSYNNELDKEADESAGIIQQYPGTIPYSGSISLRSTSSTASTQSFAFPILAQESISSPVRMPKPQKRQQRKPKQWKMKMCWLCSNF